MKSLTVGRLCENRLTLSPNCNLRFDRPFSSAKPRGSRLCQRFFTTERPIALPDRTPSDANNAITGEESRPVDCNRQAAGNSPVTSPRSFCVTMAATVRHDGVTSKGVWLVASEPKASESYEACLKNTTVQSDSNSFMGLLSANEPN